MDAGNWFWVIYVICAVFGGWFGYAQGRWFMGISVVIFILIGLLGWGVFGPPLR